MRVAIAEGTAACNEQRSDVARLIYFHLDKHEFFRHFTVKETRLCCKAVLLIY